MKSFTTRQFVILMVLSFCYSTVLSYTGEIIKSYKTPGSFPTGLTYDGKDIWLADRKDKRLYCIDPKTGEVKRSISAPAYWPMGLAWDGKNLWNVDVKGGIPLSENYNGKIYKIDPADGTILKTIQAPSNTPRGLTWDGKYLWCVDNRTDEIIQFSPDDGTTIKSFKSPSVEPRGLTFDGKYLWVSDRTKDEIYMIDPENGRVLLITDAPGPFTRGLCYDGKNLWAVDYQNDSLYQLKIKDGEKLRKYKSHKSRVTYTHQVTNFGPGKVKNLNAYIAIPLNRDNQTLIGEIKYNPEPTAFILDKWGQNVAFYNYTDIESDTVRNAEMTVDVTTYNVRYHIFPDEVGKLEDIPPDITSLYLENNEKYHYDHPTIQKGLKEAIGSEKNPYWIGRKIYDYLIDHMYYEMVGGWNTAPTVLARGNGSCSEYAFVYIAMCRAAGLPARYVGSVVIRGDDASMDDVFHRWVEIYLPNYGWIPVDPSGGDRKSPRDQAHYFGFLSNRFLITTQSGGGSELLRWTYNSDETWETEPKTNVVIDNFAEWEPIQ